MTAKTDTQPVPHRADADTPPDSDPDGPLRTLRSRWARHPTTPLVLEASHSDAPAILAVSEPLRAFWLAALPELINRPVVAILPGAADVERSADDIGVFGDRPSILDGWETLPYEHVSPSIETMGRRCAAINALGGDDPPGLTLLPVRALLQRVVPGAAALPRLELRAGATADLEELERTLAALGYERSYLVEARGEFAVRGGILDVFASTDVQPVRIEFWGDEIDTLRRFSIADQRSVASLDQVDILPARELLIDDDLRKRAARAATEHPKHAEPLERIADGEFFAGMESWLPWLLEDDEGSVLGLVPDDAVVVLCEPRRCLDRARDLRREEEDLAAALARTWQMPHAGLLEAVADSDAPEPVPERVPESPRDSAEPPSDALEYDPPRLFLDADGVLAEFDGLVWQVPIVAENPATPEIAAGSLEQTFGRPDALAGSLKELLARDLTVLVAADGMGSQARIRDLLVDEGVALAAHKGALEADPRGGSIVVAPLSRGFISTELGLALLAEPDITGRRRTHRRPGATKHRKRAEAAGTYGDLRAGDFVVHYHHGVGRFEGIVSRGLAGVDREYLDLSYAGHDKLYVPVDQADTVRKYVGGDTPRLSKMGGSDWARTKGKVRRAVAEIAEELVSLYRKRMTTQGHVFAADGDLALRLAETFPFEETPDQHRAIVDVSADMEAAMPMDRLVCGDVGYGKTEIAVRAGLKAVADGRQVGVLVPTTVLAQQHYQTFSDRYADLPVRVAMLSRFLGPSDQRRIAADTRDGRVDVLIGTHRMLQEDVGFANLGLLVVDEEQRFGVKAKERLKEIRASVDVLTMTATPIPRTLEFGLTGIRDMSVVNTPPEDRQPVLTYVGEFDEQSVAAAIRRELLRDGQVFYVHNRVRSIDLVAAQIGRLVPEARVAVAHGQMDDAALERIMLEFWDGTIDVLVATTIIESGLDIARANTLIVDRADLLGLAQLYQLRGRVGRAGERAYAYLFYPPDRVLSEEAHERLKVIAEHQDLGSGFEIAMRDLELRGAGNLLGAAQSGHIAAVGFDLYCQLVNEAVATLKGEAPEEVEPVRIDLPIKAIIPESYMPKESLRLEAYRRLGDAGDAARIDDVREEWIDRYGPMPDEVENLLELARVKAAGLRAGVNEIVFSRDQARMSPARPIGSRRMRLEREYPGLVVKEDQQQVVVPYRAAGHARRGAGARHKVSGRDVCSWMIKFLKELGE